MPGRVPTIKFNNGINFPIFGLGTWKSKPGEVTEAVKHAIDHGYRHIDCAHVYGNESEVGAALKDRMDAGVIKREDIYITSKLWCTFHSPALVEPAIRKSLSDLGLKYLDLYLIHWPVGYKEGGDLFPRDEQGKILTSDVDYIDTWKAMEQLVEKGLTKSIGISNFNIEQTERLLKNCKIVPVTNQVECHAHLNQKKLIEYSKSKNITITAYSPLGSPDRPWAKPGDVQILDDERIKKIGEKYGKSTAQILIRYQVQRGLITIPKSVNKKRIEENFAIFDFELSKSDMELIDTFDCNGRVVPFLDAVDHKYYPF